MHPLALPWLEWSILLALVGAAVVALLRDRDAQSRVCLVFSGLSFASVFLAFLAQYQGFATDESLELLPRIFGRKLFWLDELSAPLVGAVALLHFLTALATTRTKMSRFSYSGMLVAESIRLAGFACLEPWPLIGLLSFSTLPPLFELVSRGKPIRVYALHMVAFVALLIFGWWLVETYPGSKNSWVTVPLMLAILIRSGTVPVHCWLTDLAEHGSFGSTLLLFAPVGGVYAAIRLALPVAPDWVLRSVGLLSVITAVYAAGMATVQRDTRRFFAYLFLSHASLVLVGLEFVTSHGVGLTGALCLWYSVVISLGGLGLTLRALEARFGRLSLTRFHGLYDHSRMLAIFFLLTGLASVGFPGTLGYISAELLVDGALEANLYVGLAVILAGALNGIAILRTYLILFTGTRHVSSFNLAITPRERFAVIVLAALVLGGGLLPQPGVASRQRAADAILKQRHSSGFTMDEPQPRVAETQTPAEKPE